MKGLVGAFLSVIVQQSSRRFVCSSTGYPLYLPAHLWEHSYFEPSCCIPPSLHVDCWCIVIVTRCSNVPSQIQTAAIHSIPAHRSESSAFFWSNGLSCVSGPFCPYAPLDDAVSSKAIICWWLQNSIGGQLFKCKIVLAIFLAYMTIVIWKIHSLLHKASELKTLVLLLFVWERWVSSPCWLAPGCAAALCGVTRLWWLVVLLGPGACLIFSVLTFNAQYGKSYSHLGSLTAHTAPHLGVVPNSIFKLYFLTIDFV